MLVTGAAGPIAYSLLDIIADGHVFGRDQVGERCRLSRYQSNLFPSKDSRPAVTVLDGVRSDSSRSPTSHFHPPLNLTTYHTPNERINFLLSLLLIRGYGLIKFNSVPEGPDY